MVAAVAAARGPVLETACPQFVIPPSRPGPTHRLPRFIIPIITTLPPIPTRTSVSPRSLQVAVAAARGPVLETACPQFVIPPSRPGPTHRLPRGTAVSQIV